MQLARYNSSEKTGLPPAKRVDSFLISTPKRSSAKATDRFLWGDIKSCKHGGPKLVELQYCLHGPVLLDFSALGGYAGNASLSGVYSRSYSGVHMLRHSPLFHFKPGDHACVFYRSEDSLLDVLTPHVA